MNIDWEAPFTIIAPFGTRNLNEDASAGPRFLLNAKSSVGRRGIRATRDPIPQGDGEIFHDRWSTAAEMQLAMQFWNGEECACDDVLVDMYDEIRGILWSMMRPPQPVFTQGGGRLIWTPAGKAARMLDSARLFSLDDPEEDQESGCTQLTAVIDSPFPYAVSQAQTVVTINGSGSVTNNGNVDFWPVMRVYADGAQIRNETTGLEINIGSGCLGAGTFIEIETFRMTAYVDGDQANAKPCISGSESDFFPLVPGVNDITTDASVEIYVNDAFA